MGNPPKKRPRKGQGSSSQGGSPQSVLDDSTPIEIKTQLELLQAEIFDLKGNLEKATADIGKMTKETEVMRQELLQERYTTRTMTYRLNELEQYSRKNNIRIFGLRDNNKTENSYITENRVIELFRNKLNVDISPRDIQVAHRIGKFSPDSDRAIIVQFVNKKAKMVVMANRKALKGSKTVISDDLTIQNMRRLESLKMLSCVAQSWAYNGKLFAKNKNNKVKEVKSNETIDEKLFDTQSPPPPSKSLPIKDASNNPIKSVQTAPPKPATPPTTPLKVKSQQSSNPHDNNKQTAVKTDKSKPSSGGSNHNTHTHDVTKQTDNIAEVFMAGAPIALDTPKPTDKPISNSTPTNIQEKLIDMAS